jgi:glycosyltransferase involved in cell wall biosynthesis
MLVSIIIRTLNEERYLDELLGAIGNQKSELFNFEVVLVDSGSSDGTLRIAKERECRIQHIAKKEFSFGRSLNLGCESAQGDILVFISGHCIPVDSNWLHKLCEPIASGLVCYSYGRQIGRDSTKFSENQVFEKYFPPYSMAPQQGYFCNNANAALSKSVWEKNRFNEKLTGLEDMFLGKQIIENGLLIGYISDAAVFHIHDERWWQVKRRYEREAIALRKINPEIHVSIFDFARFYITGIFLDFGKAIEQKVFLKEFIGIVAFRFCQFGGGYIGNRTHRKLSSESKNKYFYPTNSR